MSQKLSWDDLKGDTHRQYGDFGWWRVLKGYLILRTFRPIVSLRLCQHAYGSNGVFRYFLRIFRLLHRINCQLASMDFPWETSIDSGLAIVHGWGLVISPGTKIGRNVTLFHGVTLGRRDQIASDGSRHVEYPEIEDEVWIGPNAIIVGGVKIGKGSRIAGGAFVVRDIPPYSIVVGNPSVVVKSNCIPDVVNPVA